jgi:hypothetical protein
MEKISVENFIELSKKWGVGFLIESDIVTPGYIRGKKLKELIYNVQNHINILKIYISGLEILLKHDGKSDLKLNDEEVKAIRDKMENL